MFLDLENEVQPKRKKGLISNIAVIVAVVIFLITVVMTITKMNNPDDSTFFGIKPIIIETGSMEPTIRTNALVIGKNVKFEDLKVGDIITFQMQNGKLNTHRIVSKSEGFEMFTTKGDNNVMPDSISITPDNYKYKIVTICNWFTELNTAKGILMYIVLPIVGIIIFIIFIRVMFGALKRRISGSEEVPVKRRKDSQYLDLIAEEHAHTNWQEENFTEANSYEDEEFYKDENVYEERVSQRENPVREKPRRKRETYDNNYEKSLPEKVVELKPQQEEAQREIVEQRPIAKVVKEEPEFVPEIQTEHHKEEKVNLMDAKVSENKRVLPKEEVYKEEIPVRVRPKETGFTGWEREPKQQASQRRKEPTRQELHKQALAQAFREILNPKDEPIYERRSHPTEDNMFARERRRPSTDWRDEIFKDVDLDDISLRDLEAKESRPKRNSYHREFSDIDLSDIDLDDIDIDDIDDIDLSDIDLDDLRF